MRALRSEASRWRIRSPGPRRKGPLGAGKESVGSLSSLRTPGEATPWTTSSEHPSQGGTPDGCPASLKSHVPPSSYECLKCYHLSLSHLTGGVLSAILPLAPFHPGCFSDPPASLERAGPSGPHGARKKDTWKFLQCAGALSHLKSAGWEALGVMPENGCCWGLWFTFCLSAVEGDSH